MITAIVRFPLPSGTSLDKAKSLFEQSAPNYQDLPGLIRKYYLYDQGNDGHPSGGGVYLWESRAAADAVYTDAWKKVITERYGTAPEIKFFESPVIVDNA